MLAAHVRMKIDVLNFQRKNAIILASIGPPALRGLRGQ